ncbi:cytochrome c oxidase subunit 3 family protein [Fundidesulfovibrio agrisoli]|uniref:cytochrome c oxidase subunit 3 family protein n=1 Tax=Fundidesulfovibrio agrisoli TaxID=2922717 RepID=UPI001FADAE85|nr:cytochrome c oxidase subunit 3 family protein [Fundidesulfovibrio agrisoli]
MSEHRDYAGGKLGMWIFLFTEILLFGGLFLLYAAYLHRYPADFNAGGKQLDVVLGAANTIILITSSFTVAASITALRLGQTARCLWLLAATVALALGFLVNKFFEWSAKIGHGIYPGSQHLLQMPPGENLFFGLYYAMTGLHGLHVLIGATLLSVTAALVRKGRVTQGNFGLLENAGLYWHLVDLVWIFLFPLFYLIA